MFGLSISSLITGLLNPIATITNQIIQLRIEREKAATDKDKIAADERIKALEAQRDVLTRDRYGWINSVARAAFVVPYVIYINKLIIWDKVLQRGSTDPLSADLTYLLMVIVGFYFVHWTVGQFRR